MITNLSLDIGGSEWIVLILLGIFLLFGTKRMPQVTRTLGRLVGEYQKAKSTIQEEITKTSRMVNTPIGLDKAISATSNTSTGAMGTDKDVSAPVTNVDTGTNQPMTGPIGTERERLEIIARTLEIEPRGKSDDELRQLISSKMNQ